MTTPSNSSCVRVYDPTSATEPAYFATTGLGAIALQHRTEQGLVPCMTTYHPCSETRSDCRLCTRGAPRNRLAYLPAVLLTSSVFASGPRVLDQVLVAAIAKTARQTAQQLDLAVCLAQQQRPAVARHLTSR